MTEEEKDSAAQEKPTAESVAPAPKPKSDMMMFIFVGVGALVVTVGVALGLMSGGHQPSAESDDAMVENTVSADKHDSPESEPETPDIFSELDDLSFLADTQFAELETPAGESGRHSGSNAKKRGQSRVRNSGAGANESQTADDSLAALSWIEAEKKKLNQRSKALDEKAKRLEALERSVNQKLTKVDQAEAARLNGLAKLYNGMKPAQVAKMMVKLDDKTVVAILPRMKSAQAAKILGLLPAGRGARISKEMITLSQK